MSATKYVVTGATGQLGRLAVEALLARGVAPSQLTATGRDTTKLADLAARGVVVKKADFDDAASLDAVFAGADRLLLVSTNEIGKRASQHRNAIDAAKRAGVKLVAYTSIANADHTQVIFGPEHRDTEQYLKASGLPYVFLRNSWYFENYTSQIAGAVAHGVVLGAAGEGRVSAATRADYAAAAAAVLTTEGHAGKAYELGGDTAITLAEYAAEIARQVGKAVVYKNLSETEYTQALVGFGVPEGYAAIYAACDAAVARGELKVEGGALAKLVGRPTATLADAVSAALATVPAAS